MVQSPWGLRVRRVAPLVAAVVARVPSMDMRLGEPGGKWFCCNAAMRFGSILSSLQSFAMSDKRLLLVSISVSADGDPQCFPPKSMDHGVAPQ
jgi:hypothetical protein